MNIQELKKIETKLLATLKSHLEPGDTVIAGISGGPDSVFLLYLLKKLPIKIIVAHVNHKLRKEADKDEKFVKKLCHDNSLTNSQSRHSQPPATILFAPLTANIESLSQKLKLGLEETGRKVRYDFFKKLAKKHQAKFVITAHHADDNLETIILNFARGASLQGMGGMQELEEITNNNSKKSSQKVQQPSALLRPLLQISKQEILAFLEHHKLPFRIDKSNNSLLYKRNFIRHKIVPLLKEINPSITGTLAKNTANMREINEYLKFQAQAWLKKNVIPGRSTLTSSPTRFSAKTFCAQPPALQKIILLQIYKHHVGNTQNLKSVNLDEILTMIQKNIGNKKKKFGTLTISLKNNVITIS